MKRKVSFRSLRCHKKNSPFKLVWAPGPFKRGLIQSDEEHCTGGKKVDVAGELDSLFNLEVRRGFLKEIHRY